MELERKQRVCGDITEIDSASVVEEEIITHYVYFTSTRTDDLVVDCKQKLIINTVPVKAVDGG